MSFFDRNRVRVCSFCWIPSNRTEMITHFNYSFHLNNEYINNIEKFMFSSISHHISLKLNCSLNWILNRTQTHSFAYSFALSLTHTIQMLNIDWPKVRTQICDIWWHCDDAIVHHLHLNMKTACLYSYLWSIVKTIVVLKCGMLEKWMNERFNEWADGWNRSVSASVSGKCRVCVCAEE